MELASWLKWAHWIDLRQGSIMYLVMMHAAARPTNRKLSFYEFFAGGGMVRAGLGSGWECLFASDNDPQKAACYTRNWGDDVLSVSDVRSLRSTDLPVEADLAWASFPCQDLSVAGLGAGLNGRRSGTFWAFWSLMRELREEGRAPNILVIENVCGLLSSHGGKDFAAICSAVTTAGYRIGAMVIDAVHFVPQSRPRLFVIAVREEVHIPPPLLTTEPSPLWHTRSIQTAFGRLPRAAKSKWIWWNLPKPPARGTLLRNLLNSEVAETSWHSESQTNRLLDLMSPLHRRKLAEVQRTGQLTVGTVYRRTRSDGYGRRVQRAEVRFDGVAGCLRTPAGGSSRQILLFVDGNDVRSRLLSPREAARLMGLTEEYSLPENPTEAHRLLGDGVVVPVVRHLAGGILEPLRAFSVESDRRGDTNHSEACSSGLATNSRTVSKRWRGASPRTDDNPCECFVKSPA